LETKDTDHKTYFRDKYSSRYLLLACDKSEDRTVSWLRHLAEPDKIMWNPSVVHKVALEWVFSQYFDFSCQFTIHHLL
jgi:hypothetical protein